MNGTRPPVPFAAQRMIFLALLIGMAGYMVAVAVVLQIGDGKGIGVEPIPVLDTVVIAVGAAMLPLALACRAMLRGKARQQPAGAARAQAMFVSTLVPIAMLEGACLFGTTVWMLNGTAVPNLVVALVALSAAITIVPFTDPDAGS